MLLFYIYIAAIVVGGGLLGAALFLGHRESDAAPAAPVADAGRKNGATPSAPDVAARGGECVDARGTCGPLARKSGVLWLPFLSVRFWVFFLCSFGLTGTVFTLLALAEKWLTLAAAVGGGIVIGFGVALVSQRPRTHAAGITAGAPNLQGQEAIVLTPLPPGGRGTIRLEVRGQTVDLVARNDEFAELPSGARVVVLEVEGSEALVVSAGSLERPAPDTSPAPVTTPAPTALPVIRLAAPEVGASEASAGESRTDESGAARSTTGEARTDETSGPRGA